MAGALDALFVVFTLFGGWSFLSSSGRKRLIEQKSRSEPTTPTSSRKKAGQASSGEESEECVNPERSTVSRTQPIAIKTTRMQRNTRLHSSSAHSLPNSQRSTPGSESSSAPRSSTSSQYSSLHDQLWQQAFRNSCR